VMNRTSIGIAWQAGWAPRSLAVTVVPLRPVPPTNTGGMGRVDPPPSLARAWRSERLTSRPALRTTDRALRRVLCVGLIGRTVDAWSSVQRRRSPVIVLVSARCPTAHRRTRQRIPRRQPAYDRPVLAAQPFSTTMQPSGPLSCWPHRPRARCEAASPGAPRCPQAALSRAPHGVRERSTFGYAGGDDARRARRRGQPGSGVLRDRGTRSRRGWHRSPPTALPSSSPGCRVARAAPGNRFAHAA